MASKKKKAEEKPSRKMLYVYLGRTIGAKDKLYIALLPTTREEWTAGKVVNHARHANAVGLYAVVNAKHFGCVGGVYEVESPEQGVIQPASARWVNWWGNNGDNDQVVTWEAKADALSLEIDLLSRAKSAKKFDAMKARLDPIKRAHGLLGGRERAILVARVVTYITGN